MSGFCSLILTHSTIRRLLTSTGGPPALPGDTYLLAFVGENYRIDGIDLELHHLYRTMI
jgi:hypothetical protein